MHRLERRGFDQKPRVRQRRPSSASRCRRAPTRSSPTSSSAAPASSARATAIRTTSSCCRESATFFPTAIFATPLVLRDRIAAVVYADSGDGPGSGSIRRRALEILTAYASRLLDSLSAQKSPVRTGEHLPPSGSAASAPTAHSAARADSDSLLRPRTRQPVQPVATPDARRRIPPPEPTSPVELMASSPATGRGRGDRVR